MTRLLHISDLHFGRPAVLEQVEAVEALVQRERYEVVAISGDVSQRARYGEFQRAHAFIRDARRTSQVICVPGNHDVAWWEAPLGVRDASAMYEGYRRFISPDLEPVLRVPGVTVVGLNSSQGITFRTLTWNMRDLSVIGDLRPDQLVSAREEFARSPEGDARVILMHHNPVKGEISRRYGLRRTTEILGAFAGMGVDIVLCGHDHQEAIHFVEHTGRGPIVSTAGTLSDRSRGGRPSSLNVISIHAGSIEVETLIWEAGAGAFTQGPKRCFAR